MGAKNAKQDKLANFMSQYEILQQIQSQNLTFLQQKHTHDQYLLRQFSFNDKRQFDKTLQHIEPLMNQLNGCKHVAPLKDYLTTSQDEYCSTFYKIYALFEYPQRTLDDEITERNLHKRKFTETELWSILASCILGLSHLQKNSIKHAALKSKNILLSKEGVIKVSDPYATGQHSNYEKALNKRSTLHIYLPPEETNALQQEVIVPNLNSVKGDIWTMGMIILEAGLLEYQDQCYRDEWSRVHWQTLQYNINRFGQTYSEELKNMLEFMLSKDEKMRPDWIELEQHVMKNNDENRKSFIQSQPNKSPSQLFSPQPQEERIPILQSPQSNFPPTKTDLPISNNPTSPRISSNRSTFQPNTYGHSTVPQARVLSFGSNYPMSSQPQNHLQPIQPSNIQYTRPFRNIFPKSTYTISTKVDENLVMVDDGDDQSNYASKEGTSRFHQPFNMITSQQQKYSNPFQQNATSFPPPYKDVVAKSPFESKYVVETFKMGSKYQGYKMNGMRHGKGKFYYQDGGMYDGDWYENKMQGYGKLYYQSGQLAYEGQWKSDQFTGKGILYNEVPDELNESLDYRNLQDVGEFWTKYEGEFRDDMKNGRGTLYFSNGQKIEAQFFEDGIHGSGKYYRNNGEVISGKWDSNQLLY